MTKIKIYTEEQVVNALNKVFIESITFEDVNEVRRGLTPIELPSDDEMVRESEVLYPINKGGSMWMPSRYDIDKKNRQEGFLDGAKWMRDKIQGGNK